MIATSATAGNRGQVRPAAPRWGRLPYQIVLQPAPADLKPGHRVTSSLAGGRSRVAAASGRPPGGQGR